MNRKDAKKRETFEREMMRMAFRAAQHSPDLSTQNGAVIYEATKGTSILPDGWFPRYVTEGCCNRLPFGVSTMAERLERPDKYLYTEHAERNAIFHAARNGQALNDCTMVALWAACADCARAIIESGITRLVTHSFYVAADKVTDGRMNWGDSIGPAFVMLEEAGVEVEFVDWPVMNHDEWLLFNGARVTF